VVQEEASKLSKRAKRRAAGEEASQGETAPEGAADIGADEDEDSPGDDATDATDDPAAAEAPNRHARRSAAAQARARRKRERAEASAIGLDAGEMVDDALVRFTDKAGRVAKRYWNVIQWVVGLGVIGWFGYQVYAWRTAKVSAEVSDSLFEAVAIEDGRIGDPSEQGKPNANGLIDPTPVFETDAARLQAAQAAYEKAAATRPNTVAAGFAELGKAGVLYAQGKPAEARASFDRVAASDAAKQSPELKGTALEGRGLSLEALNDLPGAFTAFEELASVPSFENLALYQQARVKQLQADNEAAKALLKKLFTNLGPPKAVNFGGLPERPEFLRERAVQLASVVDPLETDVKIPKPPLGPDAVQQMLEQLKESGAVTAPPPAPGP
jgi:tetratricopeptide (TPR) repeat protein